MNEILYGIVGVILFIFNIWVYKDSGFNGWMVSQIVVFLIIETLPNDWKTTQKYIKVMYLGQILVMLIVAAINWWFEGALNQQLQTVGTLNQQLQLAQRLVSDTQHDSTDDEDEGYFTDDELP